MIKFKYICDKCGSTTEEMQSDSGMITAVPIFTDEDSKWEVVHGFALCPSCKKKFYDFVNNKEK